MSPQDEGPSVHRVIIANIHNALLEMNQDFGLEPTLAESYTMSPDGLSYTFKLRKDVKFSDGTQFTSKDVKYTWEFYADPKNATAISYKFDAIASVEAPDDYTVVAKLKAASPAFLLFAPTCYIVQSAYHAQVGEAKYRTAPIGTGPFILKEWDPSHTLLAANLNFYKGRPHFDFLRENTVPEDSVRTIALQTGTAQAMSWPPLVDDSLKLAADPNFKVYQYPSTSINRFSLNNKVPALADKIVRQAMMYAINRPQIIKDVFKGAAVVADGFMMPGLPYYKADVKKYDYNPDTAKKMLDDAGYKAGSDGIRAKGNVRLSFTSTTITGDQKRRPEAEYVQKFLKDVGIEMLIAEAPVASILEGLKKGTMECSLFNWDFPNAIGDPDPSSGLASDGGDNFMQYNNPVMDDLIKQGQKEVDPAKRKVIYDKMQDLFVEEVPCIYMMYMSWFGIYSAKVKGMPATDKSDDYMWRLDYQWWLSD
jgi:peptide/nickel transport system substrate-binding protein